MQKIIVQMASTLYKWLFISVSAVVLTSAKPADHPFHVSVVEINHNATDKNLEISCKIFTDDFEKVLAQNYKTKTDLINPPNKAAMDSLVKKYVLSHLSIAINGKPVTLSYLGFENDKEAAYSYFEVNNTTSASKIDITNNLMYDLFDDQVNIMHVIVGGSRKSNKLSYPDKIVSFSF
jgi:hypothetical protein